MALPLLKTENLTSGRFSYYTINVHKKKYTQYFLTVYTNAIISSSEDRDLTHTTVNTYVKTHYNISKYSRHVKTPWFTVVIHTGFNTM